MKVTALACVIATASAAAPVIELNMEGASLGHFKLANPIYRHHTASSPIPVHVRGTMQCAAINDGSASTQEYTKRCAANLDQDTGLAGCLLPTAKGFDHQDGTNVDVMTRVYHLTEASLTCTAAAATDPVNTNDLVASGVELTQAGHNISFTTLGTYLVKYDAMDAHENCAAPIVFAVVVADEEAPVINICNGVAESVEGCSDWKLCSTTSVEDNIDGDVTATLTYSVQKVGTVDTGAYGAFVVQDGTFADAAAAITTKETGRFLVTMSAHDHAGCYGRSAAGSTGAAGDNVATARKAVLVKDTQAPWINLGGGNPTYYQCNRYVNETDANLVHFERTAYDDAGATCSDNLDSVCNNNDGGSCDVSGGQVTVNGLTTLDTTVAFKVADPTEENNHEITYDHSDKAGNAAPTKTRVVRVRDTVSPSVYCVGGSTAVYDHLVHTGETLVSSGVEQGAITFDMCDPNFDKDAGTLCTEGVTTNGCTLEWSRGDANIDLTELGHYIRTYTVTDASGNSGYCARTFEITDGLKPVLDLQGVPDLTLEAGFGQCNSDDCTEVPYANHDENLGDHAGHAKVDHTQFTAAHKAALEFGTSRAGTTAEYYDAGAKCEDPHPNGGNATNLNHAVEVSGDVVNMHVPAVYTIKYDCQDLTGNAADQVQRVVTVQDTCPPRVTLKGASLYYIEAGFEYVDAGATATDDLDGDITPRIHTDGDTVNVMAYFWDRRSCKAIKEIAFDSPSQAAANARLDGADAKYTNFGGSEATLASGMFYITDPAQTDSDGNDKLEVWCDFEGGRANTYKLVSGEAVAQLGGSSTSKCQDFGMKLASVNALGDSGSALAAHVAGGDWAAAAAATTTDEAFCHYICDLDETISGPLDVHGSKDGWRQGDKDADVVGIASEFKHGVADRAGGDSTSGNPHAGHSSKNQAVHTTHGAEAGKYVIFFHVQDHAGNDECDAKSRTVVVRDTLPPVISLHDTLTGDLLHVSDYTQLGLGFEANPAGKPAHADAHGYDHNTASHIDGNPYLYSVRDTATHTHLPLANGQVDYADKATLSASSTIALPTTATRPSTWLMAEQQASSSSNGWIMAAAASGITGLALLASAQRKTTVTSVPV